MKLQDFNDLNLDNVDVVDIRDEGGKIKLELYPPKATDKTKEIVLNNREESPVNVSDEPVRDAPGEVYGTGADMEQMKMDYMCSENVVWTALKKKIGGVLS